MFALLILVFLIFAAFTVDLGAAWAERRQDQTAADAAAMAGAIEYIVGAPSEDDVINIVKDYVEHNIGLPAGSGSWYSCPAPPAGYASLLDAAGTAVNCVSLRQADTEVNNVLFRVRIPDQAVPTTFARIIGIDTIDVSAVGIAETVPPSGVAGALPFFVPNNPGAEYCLGTPPSGQAREYCEGPSNGNFGSMDSPFFGTHPDAEPWGTTSCVDSPTNNNTRIVWNTAIGIDHDLRDVGPDSDLSPVEGADVCEAATKAAGGWYPYAIVGDQGSLAQASDGFIGAGPYGNLPLPGRLRQENDADGGIRDTWRPVPSGKDSIDVDNVGLWQYLVPGLTMKCHSDNFDPNTYTGTELTVNLLACLDEKDGVEGQLFEDALVGAPRFAIVPQIDASQAEIGEIGPNSKAAINIVDFVPVYLQASWYNCSATECMYFETDDLGLEPMPTTTTTLGEDPPVVDSHPQVLEPGEGKTIGCLGDPEGENCAKNVNLVLEGISALILEDGWFSTNVKDEWGEFGAPSVRLYK